jgi:P4 family phage/plasmid primase-like protien
VKEVVARDDKSTRVDKSVSPEHDEREALLRALEKRREALGEDFGLLKGLLNDFSIALDKEGLVISWQGASRRCDDPSSLQLVLELLMYDMGLGEKLGKGRTGKLAFLLSKALSEALREVCGEEVEKSPFSLASALGISKEAVEKLLGLKSYSRLSERLAVAAEVLASAVIEHFEHVKNFTTGDNVDLGLYSWDGRRWRPLGGLVGSWIKEVYDRLSLKDLGIRYRQLKEEVLEQLRDMVREPLRYELSVVAFENCAFNFDTWQVEEHSPERVAFHYVPHKVDVDLLKKLLEDGPIEEEKVAEWAPKTLMAFREWVGDKWLLLFELMGFLLYPKPYKKAVLLVDAEGKAGDTGKSTYIRYLEELLGRENYCSIPLQALTDPEYRFTTSQLYGKLANFYADLPEVGLKNVGQLKVLTGEDTITIERKHKDPFTWLPYTKHVFSANEPPPVKKADKAFWKRWLVVEFSGNFKERIRGFEKTLLDELPKAIPIAIAAFKGVLERGSFSFEDTAEDAKNKWMARSDVVFAFMEWLKAGGALVEDRSAKVEVSELYRYFTRYCELMDKEAADPRIFTLRLKALGYTIKRPKNVSTLYGYRLDVKVAEGLFKGEAEEGEAEAQQSLESDGVTGKNPLG